ncbi:MAG: FdhF/YdeP family oxidoreductase [Candidatus Obscuribacterales bacterium]|nr:FdhF/YdeP family oxidoreductase [Candidatus Obscuribacterales bacterium]
MSRGRYGGGFPAIAYTFKKAMEAGPLRLWRKMRSKNACKTCALGMGGQLGGMVNERGHFPEVCKKSLQAQVADMQGAIQPEFFERNSLSDLLKLTPKQAEDAGRLSFPLILEEGESHFKPLSWEAAMNIMAESLKKADPQSVGFYSSGRSSNEAAFLLSAFARVYGSNNVMNCSYYCHQASGVALKMSIGSGTATIELDDLKLCDLLVLAGANPASNHPRLMTLLAELRERGGHVIVINPLFEKGLEKFHVPSRPMSLLFGSEIASEYLQVKAGGDAALFIGALKSLIENKLVKLDFLDRHVNGYKELFEDCQSFSWQDIEERSGLRKVEIENFANYIAASKACIFAWAMGLTHHKWGVDNILALSNLALATGNVGKPGAGLLPIRGHSNVQGIGSMGFSPSLAEGLKSALEAIYKKDLPVDGGYDTHALISAAEQGKIDCLFVLGGNLWGSNPDSDWAGRAMQKIPDTFYLSTKLNPGHFHGRAQRTLILPVLARDEEKQASTQESMFNFVRLSDGGEENIKGQLRAEAEIIVDLAERVLSKEPFDWSSLRDYEQIRKQIARVIPGWQEIENIGKSAKEFTIAGRVFHKPEFPLSADGKAQMHRVSLPPKQGDEFRLITLRSEGQFNSVVYEEHDLYRGVPHRYCVLISQEDASRLDLKDGQKISLRGEAGRLENLELFVTRIKSGSLAMYYPEANVLIKGHLDERSKTPAFKSAAVWIESPGS